MSDTVFLVRPDGSLAELNSAGYATEDLLQGLLERYPRLLHGAGSGAQLLLVKREAGIPGEADGVNRWSLDHLFLDSAGIPTLVEVKRRSDTRIRREVVGQLLDYAANAVVYWPLERLRLDLEQTITASGRDPESVVQDFLGPDRSADEFWQTVKTNLQAGRIRLLFVADRIPMELRRIIEFLNEQMDPAEVLGIEMRQYQGESVQSLVPVVVGATAEAERRKAPGGKTTWDQASLISFLRDRNRPEDIPVIQHVLRWAETRGLRLWWGSGSSEASFYPQFDIDATTPQYTAAFRSGTQNSYVQLQLPSMKPPFDEPPKKLALLEKVESATGVAIESDAKYPGIRFSDMGNGQVDALLEVFDWIIEETRRTHFPSQTAD